MEAVKSQKSFLLLVGTSVVVLSFAYGLSVGLKRSRNLAHARPMFSGSLLDEAEETLLLGELGLPKEVTVTRLGKNAAVNDRPATIVSFSTTIAPDRLLREQKQFWESTGFKMAAKTGENRGVLIGFDPVSRRKISVSAWTLPKELRSAAGASALPVQGMLSLLEDEKIGTGISIVPEVPVIPGGRGGAVFRADEGGGESYSSVYSNPGSLEENLEYYRRELPAAGWAESNSGGTKSGRYPTGHLMFRRNGEEVVLLFTPKGEEETVVAVFRGPKMDIPRGVF